MSVKKNYNNLNLQKKFKKKKRTKVYLSLKDKLYALRRFYQKSLYIVQIDLTLNNIYITVTSSSGKVIVVGSGGVIKLKNSKRNTTYVMQLLLISILKKLKRKKITFIVLKVVNLKKKYRKIILKYIQLYHLKVLFIQNILKKSYNGVKLKKKRRV